MSGTLPPPISPGTSTGKQSSGPKAKKRTSADRDRNCIIPTSPISKGGFTTRLPCPVNVTVQAQQPSTNSRGTYLAPLSKDLVSSPVLVIGSDENETTRALEFIRELGLFNAEEMELLESLGNPMNLDILHPNFKILFGGTLQRAGTSVESFVKYLPVLPSNPNKYFKEIRSAMAYEVFNKMEDGHIAEMIEKHLENGKDQKIVLPPAPQKTIFKIVDNSKNTTPPSSTENTETLPYSNEESTVDLADLESNNQTHDASAVLEIRKLAQNLIYFKSNRSKYGKFQLNSETAPHMFLKIVSKGTSDLVGLPVGTYIQKDDILGSKKSEYSTDFLVRLAGLIISQGLQASIVKGGVGSMSTIEVPRVQASEERIEAKRIKSDCTDSNEKVSVRSDAETERYESNSSTEESSSSAIATEAKISSSENSNDISKRKPVEAFATLCRVEDLWD